MNIIVLSILNLIKGQVGDIILISNFDSTAFLYKLTELQNFISTLSIQDGPIASAHVILLAAVLATYPITMGLPNAEAYSQMVFFIILSSVIITMIGLGKSKKIPPPESVEGGFVKPIKDSQK